MQRRTHHGPGSVVWKIGSEAAINLGGGRAVLMQLAHPLVAAGVGAHSSYLSDPLGRSERTYLLGQMVTFGSPATVHKAARIINRQHRDVQGTLATNAGAFSIGTPYNARDPKLLLWVHATLIDTILMIYPMLVGPLSEAEEDEYYEESKEVAHLLGLPPSAMPARVRDLRTYVNDMVHGNLLAATPQARQIARTVLFPPLSSTFRPLLHLHFQMTIGLLPEPVRTIYGFEWGKNRQAAFDLSFQAMKMIIPRLPEKLRVFPITREMAAYADKDIA